MVQKDTVPILMNSPRKKQAPQHYGDHGKRRDRWRPVDVQIERRPEQDGAALQESPKPLQREFLADQLEYGAPGPEQHAVELAGAYQLAHVVETAG